MYIVNKTDSKIFWRTFKRNDDSHWFGVGEGYLEPGDYTTWWVGSKEDAVQLEVKKDDLYGAFIQKSSPNITFGMEAEVEITAAGVIRLFTETTA